MTKFNLLICLLTLSFCFCMTSCKKEKGCTDSSSPSYNEDAEKDDGSCKTIADALSGTWNVTKTFSYNENYQAQYEGKITVVDENTILYSSDSLLLGQGAFEVEELFEFDADWTNKTLQKEGTDLEGTITDLNKLEILYILSPIVGIYNDTIRLNLTR